MSSLILLWHLFFPSVKGVPNAGHYTFYPLCSLVFSRDTSEVTVWDECSLKTYFFQIQPI